MPTDCNYLLINLLEEGSKVEDQNVESILCLRIGEMDIYKKEFKHKELKSLQQMSSEKNSGY